MKNKRGDSNNILIENVIFFVIVTVFFVVLFLFVTRAGSQSTVVEQIYAKQIALAIDKAKPGTGVSLDISELQKHAEKNNYYDEIINIDNENNEVSVRVVKGKGYEFEFFNDNEIVWKINKEKLGTKLFFEVKK